jgi:hypothetical protein
MPTSNASKVPQWDGGDFELSKGARLGIIVLGTVLVIVFVGILAFLPGLRLQRKKKQPTQTEIRGYGLRHELDEKAIEQPLGYEHTAKSVAPKKSSLHGLAAEEAEL